MSRSRYYGVCLPIYPCKECGKVTVVGSLDELKELSSAKEVDAMLKEQVLKIFQLQKDAAALLKIVTNFIIRNLCPLLYLSSNRRKIPR